MADVFVTAAGLEVVRQQEVEARVTSSGIEVIRNFAGTSRVTQVGLEVIRPDQPAETLEITNIGIQVAHDNTGDFDMIVSQEGAEPIIGGADASDLTQEGVEATIGGPDNPDVTQEGVEVIWRGDFFTGCESGSVFYRVRLRLPGESVDLAQYTSLPTGDNSIILDAPRIDASTIDVLRGETTVGGCTIQLADADEGTCLVPDPTTRRITKFLADSEAQSQLLGARLYIEATDNPAPAEEDWLPYWAGYVASMRFANAITVEISGAHTTRDDSTTMVWKEPAGSFRQQGYIMGGPTRQNWPSSKSGQRLISDEGFWSAEVTVVTPTYVELDINEDFSQAFPPEDVKPYIRDNAWIRFNNNNAQRNVFSWAERNAQPYFSEGAPDATTRAAWEAVNTFGWFPRLRFFTVLKNSSFFINEFPVMASEVQLRGPVFNPELFKSALYQDLGNKFRVYWPDTSPIPQPVPGDEFSFYVRALDVSEANPLLIAKHPVDILTDLWDDLDIEYDANTAADVKEALGDFIVALRITEPMSLKDAQTMLCGGFGFGWRFDPDGMRRLFTTRVRPAISGTITLDDLVSDEGVVWENEESSRVFSASYKWKRFMRWPGQESGKDADRAFDGIMPYDVGPIVFQTDDLGSKPFGARDEQYEIPGSVYALQDGEVAPNWTVADHVDITANLTAPILEQFGRGAIQTTLNLNHCVLVQEGEDWELELPHRPGFDALETPVAQRGIVERVQCISRTPQPWGSTVTLVRVPQTEGGVVPSTPGVGTAEPITLSAIVHDGTATGGDVIDESDIDDTFVAYPYYNSFILSANSNDYYDLLGARIAVDFYEGAAEPLPDQETRFTDSWDGLNAIEVGSFQPTSLVWYRTQVRLASGYVFAASAWASVQLNGTTQAATPTVSLTPDGSWNIDAEIVAAPTTVRLYVAASTTAYPTEAATLLETPIAGNTASLTALVPTLAEAETAYVTAIAEDVLGNRSIVSTSFFTRPGGGTGGGAALAPIYTKYDPFCPPAVPSALDDEFDVDGSGIPVGMASIGTLSVAEAYRARGKQYLRAPANGTLASVLLVRSLPSGPFTIGSHFAQLGRTQYSKIGLHVRSSVSSRRMQINHLCHTTGIGSSRISVESYSANDTRSANNIEQVWHNQTAFVRIAYDGTTLDFQVSEDGSYWVSMFSQAVTTHFTGGNLPDQFGLVLISENASVGGAAAVDFVRYFPTANADIGRNIGVGSDGALLDPTALYLHNKVI